MSNIAIGSVVAGVDGSGPSQAALDWAIDEATRRGLPLHLVHAQGIDDTIAAALINAPAWRGHGKQDLGEEPELNEVPVAPETYDDVLAASIDRARALAPRVRVSVEAPRDHPSQRLVGLSKRANCVVVGAQGHSLIRGLLLGSVSTQVAAHGRCPVVVVREPTVPVARLPRVVVGVDGSPVSIRAIEYAFEQASWRGVGLTAVHAWWLEYMHGVIVTTSSSKEWARLAEQQQVLVSESLVGWREKYPDVDVREHIVRSRPVAALLDHCADAELLVVGSRGRGGFGGLVMGSVSHAVLQRAQCPVAVVHPE